MILSSKRIKEQLGDENSLKEKDINQREEQIYETLRRYWGYDSFLPLQKEIILSILKGEDSLTVLPTGGGKSLCFQLPALLKKRMAVIISPLISLMKDQVDDLQDMGIASCYLNSSLPFKEQRMTIKLIREGKMKLLYISPERLENEETIELLTSFGISFFVIDEAHCISHWGHDFRISYRNLRIIKERFKNVSAHAFTATATKKVQLDIIEQLGLVNPKVYIGPVDRPNLVYRVMSRKQILEQIMEVLKKHTDEAGIIYCLRRRDVDDISESLKSRGIDNVPYHAGMPDKKRRLAQ